ETDFRQAYCTVCESDTIASKERALPSCGEPPNCPFNVTVTVAAKPTFDRIVQTLGRLGQNEAARRENKGAISMTKTVRVAGKPSVHRARAVMGAQIIFNDRASVIDCVVT